MFNYSVTNCVCFAELFTPKAMKYVIKRKTYAFKVPQELIFPTLFSDVSLGASLPPLSPRGLSASIPPGKPPQTELTAPPLSPHQGDSGHPASRDPQGTSCDSVLTHPKALGARVGGQQEVEGYQESTLYSWGNRGPRKEKIFASPPDLMPGGGTRLLCATSSPFSLEAS